MESLNHKLFLTLNAPAAPPAALLHLGQFCAQDTIFIVALVLVYLWLRGGDAKRRPALKGACAAFAGLLTSRVIGHLWFQPRPFMLHLGHTFIKHAPDATFPSDHATAFAAIGFCLLAAETRVFGGIVFLLALAMAWGRIYMGLHFPLDMLGGLALGAAASLFVSLLWGKCGAAVEIPLVRLYRVLFAPLIARGWVKP